MSNGQRNLLVDQIRRGYATASTNTGHEAAAGVNMARFAFDHPEQLIDFAYCAHHETAQQNSIDYYESVRSFFGAGDDVQSFYRLFMTPGMAHCSGGPGPNSFDMLTPLEDWVERGIAPQQIIVTHSINGVVDRSRRLCPSPEIAAYKGKGDTNDAANFVCRDAK